jgi:hypothetical protein
LSGSIASCNCALHGEENCLTCNPLLDGATGQLPLMRRVSLAVNPVECKREANAAQRASLIRPIRIRWSRLNFDEIRIINMIIRIGDHNFVDKYIYNSLKNTTL